MSAPTGQEIREAVEQAGDKAYGRGEGIDTAVHSWTAEVLELGPWQRWTCDDDKCPGRPESDKALDDVYAEVTAELERECTALVVNRLTSALAKFAKEYPDAPRRKVEVAA